MPGTIGVVSGGSFIRGAEFVRGCVDMGTNDPRFNFQHDQQHPEIVHFAMTLKNQGEFNQMIDLLIDIKVDLIVVVDQEYKPKENVNDRGAIPLYVLGESKDDLYILSQNQKVVSDICDSDEEYSNPDVSNTDSCSSGSNSSLNGSQGDLAESLDKLLVKEFVSIADLVESSLQYVCDDGLERRRAVNPCEEMEIRRKELNGDRLIDRYLVLKERNLIGVIGGAGPATSANFCQYLTRTYGCDIEYVHISRCSAPYKINGYNFVPYYQESDDLLTSLGVGIKAMPCNTAHQYKNDIFKKPEECVDIRQAVFDYIKKNISLFGNKIILLGTEVTTGVRVDSDKEDVEGIYYQMKPQSMEVILPNKAQQAEIMKAIFDIKAGKLDQAKEKIIKVVNEIRNGCNKVLPGICACTELDIPYNEEELGIMKLISASYRLADACVDIVRKKSCSIQV